MAFGNKQSGSAAFVGIAAMGALGLAFIFSQENAVRTKQAVDRSKLAAVALEKQTGAMSALGHYKALISPKKVGATWKPALFATNYFDKSWTIMAATGTEAKFVQKNAVETSVNLLEPAIVEADLAAVMTKAAAPKKETFVVKFLTPNFDSKEKLVQSVDVEVTGKEAGSDGKAQSMQVLARVPLPPPVPYDARLFWRKPGGTWTQMVNNADLTEGPYEFIAHVSGIAFDGDLLVDGSKLNNRALFGGRDADGRVTHKAVNYENIGGEMGPAFLYDPAPEPEPAPPKASTPTKAKPTEESSAPVSTDGTSCGFTKGSYGSTSGSGTGTPPAEPPPAPPAPVLPLTATFQVEIRGPDGLVPPTGKSEVFIVKIRKPPPPPPPATSKGGDLADTGGRALTPDDYRNKCTAECPYIGEKRTGDDIGGHAGFVSQGPVSAMHTFVEGQERWGIMTKKVCFKFPGGPKPGYSLHDSEVWAYDPNTCKGQKLFARGACGCLTGETKILLGDGKTEKRIDEMNEYDRAWNPMLKKSFAVRKYTVGPESKPLIRINVDQKAVTATSDHPFVTRLGLKPASQLRVGDSIQVSRDSWQTVHKIEEVAPPSTGLPQVWNLELDGPDDDLNSHYIVANGIMTGDLLIQKTLKNQSQLGSNLGSKLD